MNIHKNAKLTLLSEATRALLRPGGLLDQSEASLRRTLVADPRDMDALWKLAEIHRRQGNFTAARELYGRLRERGPDPRKAAWLHATLSGNGAPEPPPGGIWPAPFVQMTNFLAPGESERLLALAIEGRERFAPAQVGPRAFARVDYKARITLEADERTLADAWSRIGPKIKSLVPEILARLRMDGIGRYSIDAGMRVYLDGGFYRPHRDNTARVYRTLSFVYFFNRQPLRFSGGDLLLYDSDAETGAHFLGGFSRFVPFRNSIVFFPSGCCHQVTPVQCATNDFGDGRWTLNGHVCRRDRDSGQRAGTAS